MKRLENSHRRTQERRFFWVDVALFLAKDRQGAV